MGGLHRYSDDELVFIGDFLRGGSESWAGTSRA